MSKKTRIIFYLAILPVCTFSLVFGEDLEQANLPNLIRDGLQNNPKIQAAYNKWQAALKKSPQVSSLPDPVVGITIPGESIQTRAGPQKNKYSVSQKVPFPAKLSVKAKAALKQAEAMREEYEAVKQEIIMKIKFLYYDIWGTDKAMIIVEEEKSILENLTQVSRRKYETNLSNQQEIIKLEIELTNFIKRLLSLKQGKKSLVLNINNILNRSPSTEIGVVPDLEIEAFDYRLDYLKNLAQNNRQELRRGQFEIERAEFEESLAKLDYAPDFTLGFDYIDIGSGQTTSPDDGKDAWMGSVNINLPVWGGRNRAQIEEKKEAVEVSKKEYDDLKNNVIFEVEDLFFKITTYYDMIELYRTALIPQTEQAFKADSTGYETGSIDFLDWLDTERTLLQTRLAYYKIMVDYNKSIAYLERVVGQELEDRND